MRWFKQQGWQVDYASPGDEQVLDADNHYIVNITRKPFSLRNIKAIKVLQKLFNENQYDIIHCHTPVPAAITRIVSEKSRKKGSKIIYTAHGFHFYKGAPIINWIFYSTIEKILVKYTDALITINDEDYNYAVQKLSKYTVIYKINGVGVDLSRFCQNPLNRKMNLRKEMGYKDDDFILIFVAEINKNKNQIYFLKYLNNIIREIPNIKILFAGYDNYKYVWDYAKKRKLISYIDFLGYRSDIERYYTISDICFSVSRREGLPVNILEGMASGLPVVCSKNRGHNELITHGRNGFLFDLKNPLSMADSIAKLFNDADMRHEIAVNNIHDVKKYSVDIVVEKMANIYKQYM
ncbi:putative glycosyltransferase EpsD [Spirochaetia bacterium]|nr:putative glycosyltransferase EpsD [Spirochaetia bacterium]